MPFVTDEFVKHAKALAEVSKASLQKKANDEAALRGKVEAVANVLISQNLVPPAQKQAAVASLMNHAQTLDALQQTAQIKTAAVKVADAEVPAASMGRSVQTAAMMRDANGEPVSESTLALYRGLGFSV